MTFKSWKICGSLVLFRRSCVGGLGCSNRITLCGTIVWEMWCSRQTLSNGCGFRWLRDRCHQFIQERSSRSKRHNIKEPDDTNTQFHTATAISKTSKCGRGQTIVCLCNFEEGEAFRNYKVQVKMVWRPAILGEMLQEYGVKLLRKWVALPRNDAKGLPGLL